MNYEACFGRLVPWWDKEKYKKMSCEECGKTHNHPIDSPLSGHLCPQCIELYFAEEKLDRQNIDRD